MADTTFSQPLRTLNARWTGYRFERDATSAASVLYVAVELQDSNGVPLGRDVIIVAQQGQPVYALIDGRRIQLAGSPPASLLTAVNGLNTEITSLLGTVVSNFSIP